MQEDLLAGHRDRAKEKLLKSKASSLSDYELVELVLFYSIPRKDVKPLAKKLIKQFGNVGNVVNAPIQKLDQIPGVGKSTIVLLKLLQSIIREVSKEQITDKPVINSWDQLIIYLRANIGYKTTENFHTLFLNSKNILIEDETHDHGTVNSIGVYPRELVKSALYHDASSVILVHNHPSGITKPSKADISLTDEILKALDAVGITLIDHVIISKNSYFSFKANKLL
ncbi:MAG: DNA repair protein RadC [Alphaproteobacteria bacterium]|nr:DNA repair protein RadC [Alphaproteobacteria bacterium]